MKFVALLVALSFAFPLSVVLRSNETIARVFWVLVGFMPLVAPGLPIFDIGIVSWSETWVGYVYSLEITVLDIVILAAFFSVPGPGLPWSFKVPALLFLLALAASMLQADEPLAAFFGVWQYARMVLVTTVVARACRADPDTASRILLGMALGMGVQLFVVLEQRLLLGFTQARGLFVHQNTLGIITHLVLMPHLAMLLYGKSPHSSSLRNIATVGATVLVVVFTASRGTIGLCAVGMAFTYLALSAASLTPRKIAMAAAAGLALLVVAPLVTASFQERFAASPLREDVYDERAAFDRAAIAIALDHPFGVGTNHYVHVAREGGYSERAGVARSEGNRKSLVHNAYWLTASETGWLGLAAFILMLATPLAAAFVNGWRTRATLGGHLLIGLGAGLMTVYLQSLYEWVLYSREVQYVASLTMGMAFGLALVAKASSDARRTPAARRPRATGAIADPGAAS